MKKLFTWSLVIVMTLALILGAIGCAKPMPAPTPTYHWKIGHSKPITDPQHKDQSWLVDKIYRDSDGRIVIDIYPAGQLGDYTIVQERVSLGAIETYMGPLSPGRDKRLMLQMLPYMVASWDDAEKLFTSGSALMNIVDDILADQNIKLICSWPLEFGGIGVTKLPPATVDLGDPDVPKKLKIRVPPMKQFELMVEAFGYIPTPIPWSEAVTALQSGIVDGLIGGGASGYYTMLRDVLKYFLDIYDHFEIHYWYMNLDLWNSLSAADQKIIMDAAKQMEARRFVDAKTEKEIYCQLLREAGIEIITFSDAELAKMTKKVHEQVWPALREDIGGELMDKVLAELD